MCGIAGFLDSYLSNPEKIIKSMTDKLAHRGPDDEGHWCDGTAGVALGHRRLSIIDLSRAGHQPMFSASGRYVIVFNGEIYNHRLIQTELEQLSARSWRGHSDTEVMLDAFETWGIEASVKRFIGMFAIAVWDRKERVLYLIRDRIGEKPLYYGLFKNSFIFGSELKALEMHPAFNKEIDRGSLALYMRYCYIPAPYTIYKGVHKLPPGTMIKVDINGIKKHIPEAMPYWTARKAAEDGLLNPLRETEQETMKELERLLLDAVGKQMIADVPLGAFLSGGIDSSTIVSLMQAQSSRPVKTFTIGFSDKEYNEAPDAKKVARYLGTDHTELYVSPDDVIKISPKLPEIYDEPFGDSS